MAVLGLRRTWAFSSDGKWGYSLVAQNRRPGSRASVGALQNAGSSRTRDRTHVPCTGKQILNHWTAREVQTFPLHSTVFIRKWYLRPVQSVSIIWFNVKALHVTGTCLTHLVCPVQR